MCTCVNTTLRGIIGAIDINAGGTAVLTFKITGSDDTLATFVNSKKDSLKGSLTADIQLKLTMKGIFGTILRGVTLSITGNDVEASVSVQDVYAKPVPMEVQPCQTCQRKASEILCTNKQTYLSLKS
eukprot:715370-Pelagomonas_calceolata.AAC.1